MLRALQGAIRFDLIQRMVWEKALYGLKQVASSAHADSTDEAALWMKGHGALE